jgi:hypothetical protein
MGVLAGPAPPSVSNVIATDPVDLQACSTVVIWCNATISDGDGWEDIDTVNATLWDTGSTTEGASDNNSNHYTNYSCALGTNTSLNDVPANCSFTLQYYANPAEWTCKVYANDTSSNFDSNSTADVTINTLRALDAENTINFGSLAPGATSPADINNTATNCGNSVIDLNLSGTNLTNASATVTNISLTYVKYNVTDAGQNYTVNMTSLTETPVTRTEFSLAKRTNGPSNQTTYWKIGIPAVIEGLVYTGNVNFTAVADT